MVSGCIILFSVNVQANGKQREMRVFLIISIFPPGVIKKMLQFSCKDTTAIWTGSPRSSFWLGRRMTMKTLFYFSQWFPMFRLPEGHWASPAFLRLKEAWNIIFRCAIPVVFIYTARYGLKVSHNTTQFCSFYSS